MLANAIAVLRRYLPTWTLQIHEHNLVCLDEAGVEVLVTGRLSNLPLMRQLMLFIQRIKMRFAPRKVLLTWRDAFRKDIPNNQSQAVYAVIDHRIGHDGTVWLGLAYGVADRRGVLWRRA